MGQCTLRHIKKKRDSGLKINMKYQNHFNNSYDTIFCNAVLLLNILTKFKFYNNLSCSSKNGYNIYIQQWSSLSHNG
jgi:hypothetical protein